MLKGRVGKKQRGFRSGVLQSLIVQGDTDSRIRGTRKFPENVRDESDVVFGIFQIFMVHRYII